MPKTFLKNTTRAMKAVACMDGHVYHLMPRSKNSIPDEVDGELPKGVVKVVIPMKSASPHPRPMTMRQEPQPPGQVNVSVVS